MSVEGESRVVRFCGAFDTETCNYVDAEGSHRAYTVCYQVNDLRGVPLQEYEPGVSDHIVIYRCEADMVNWLFELVDWGDRNGIIPVVGAYNLMFDLQTLLDDLGRVYPIMQVKAQTSKTVYTLDLMRDKQIVLRFWDCYHLNRMGLSAMGALAGLPKLSGEWDYQRIRTPETPLTRREREYAARDVQVIPAYLHYLLMVNPWIGANELGWTVITATSLVRRFAREKIGSLHDVGGRTLWECYRMRCQSELPKTYASYAWRRACFRGGLCFTSAKMASIPTENVASLDVTSMHHTFMARAIPVEFHEATPGDLEQAAARILSLSVGDVLSNYVLPFPVAFHGRFAFHNLRRRAGSGFEEWDIATLGRAKFRDDAERFMEGLGKDEREEAQGDSDKGRGYHDTVINGLFAFGKLCSADYAVVHLNEVEMYIMSLVYEWDEMDAMEGEITSCWRKCPDYIGLQSRLLYAQKAQIKELMRRYKPGKPFKGRIGEHVAVNIAGAARAGVLAAEDLDAYYYHVKSMFNAIYGTTSQNEFKPSFVMDHGVPTVDQATVVTPENFDFRRRIKSQVLYTYGMRIVAGSRLHLVLAIHLLWEAFGRRVDVLGGDTDSLKIRCDCDVTDEAILHALKPLHDAADDCIQLGYTRTRREFAGTFAVDMPDVGHFDIETVGAPVNGKRCTRYPAHIELWNKCRVSVRNDGELDVTCAGLSRPAGLYTINDWYKQVIRKHGIDWALVNGIGYDTFINPDVCHAIGRTTPKPSDKVDVEVKDYRGVQAHVQAHEAIALYDVGHVVGATSNGDVLENILYLDRFYGRETGLEHRFISRAKET